MTTEFDSIINTIICGDCLPIMKEWPNGVLDCCVTSPPYWGLRDYGTAKWEGGDTGCDHAPPDEAGQTNKPTAGQRTHAGRFSGESCWKCGGKRIDNQLGLEKTPEEYVAKMVEVFREVKRVLKKEGTLWLNLGDSYNGSGGDHKKDGKNDAGFQGALHRGVQKKHLTSLKPKDLCGIPWRVAFALQADGWYLRQDIIWHKPNPMPESVTDRCTKAHEYIFLLTKSPKYYYDNEAIREITGNEATPKEYAAADGRRHFHEHDKERGMMQYNPAHKALTNPLGRNKRSVWTVTTKPYSQAHFATFPPKLIEPCILAGCPKQVCVKCGKARVRIVERDLPQRNKLDCGNKDDRGVTRTTAGLATAAKTGFAKTKTIGWTSCNCNAGFRPGIVFDPFMGSGTVAEVAIKLKRDYAGCELNQEYIDLGRVKAAETGVSVKEQNAGQMALFEG